MERIEEAGTVASLDEILTEGCTWGGLVARRLPPPPPQAGLHNLKTRERNMSVSELPHKRFSNRVFFTTEDGKLYAALLRTKYGEDYLVNAAKLPSGRIAYSYALDKQYWPRFGLTESYIGQQNRIKEMADEFELIYSWAWPRY